MDLEFVVEVSTKDFDDIVSFFLQHGFFPYHMENDYSAASNMGKRNSKRLERFAAAPKGVQQEDVIFSRVDSAWLI